MRLVKLMNLTLNENACASSFGSDVLEWGILLSQDAGLLRDHLDHISDVAESHGR